MPIFTVDPDASQIIALADVAVSVFGRDWVRRRLAKEGKKKTRKAHVVVFQAPEHPFIEWMLGFERFRSLYERTGQIRDLDWAIRVASLGQALATTPLKGVEFPLKRLQQPREFLAAVFEIEVASRYALDGSEVEFLPVGQDQTPDLFVQPPNAPAFHVECKSREALNAVDRAREQFWDGLAQYLLREMGKRKLNYQIRVRSGQEPNRRELRVLCERLVKSMEKAQNIGEFGANGKLIAASSAFASGFKIATRRLCGPNEIVPADYVAPNGWPGASVFDTGEYMQVASGERVCRNRRVLTLGSHEISDRVSGILDSFRAAKPQLPKEGPGVIWIRIPDGQWSHDLSGCIDQAETLLAQELSGDDNRRVNCVGLVTRRPEHYGDGQQFLYEPVVREIWHKNPRSKMAMPAHEQK